MCRWLSACWVLVLAGAAFAGEPGPSVVVTFRSFHGHERVVRVSVSGHEYRELEVAPQRHQDFILEARRQYAESLGYSRRTHGPDVWKVVPGLRVTSVKLFDATGRSLRLR